MDSATELTSPATISYYANIWETKKAKERSLTDILNGIIAGTWQDDVFAIRAEKDHAKRQDLKKKVPCVTISGSFHERNENSLRAHSGYIAIDIDDLGQDVDGVKDLLKSDPYVYAIFLSISGKGLCVIFHIDGEKHFEAFEGIANYLYHNYRLIVDQSGKNISRARYVSYDPFLYSNPKALKFKKYLPKPKAQKINRVVYVKSDFDAIVKEFHDRSVNICEDYPQWVSVGFALASQFGNSQEGRDYFHTLSSLSSKYDANDCDRMFNGILKSYSESKSKKSTIATIYFYAKINGIQTYSDFTRKVIVSTTTLKKSGINSAAIAENLRKFEQIPIKDSADIINQAIAHDVEITEGESIITDVERWLKYNYELRRNLITRKIENYGTPLEQKDFNTIFLECKKAHEKLDYNLFERIVLSNGTDNYNPILDFFTANITRTPSGVIESLADTITTNNATFACTFIKKWLVGAISAIHGEHSPLMLILAGTVQNSGKTEFFRRLLPKELKPYYAESKLDAGKDDEILMTQKWFIMDDEMGGKSKNESKRLKELTSKQTFSLREPYGKSNADLHRIAVLCGTTNDLQILNDPTGNRRLIPIEVHSINKGAYNSIDKTDVIMEAFHLYKSGFKWQLSSEDIAYLNENTDNMEDFSMEYELIQRYLKLPSNDDFSLDIVEMSCTEILNYIISQTNNSKINTKKIGAELKKIGFESVFKKINKKTAQLYRVIKVDNNSKPNTDEDLPF